MGQMSTEDPPVKSHDSSQNVPSETPSADSTSQTNVSEESTISDGTSATEESNSPSVQDGETPLVNAASSPALNATPQPDSQSQSDGTSVEPNQADTVPACAPSIERPKNESFPESPKVPSPPNSPPQTLVLDVAPEQPSSSSPSLKSDTAVVENENTSATSLLSHANDSCEESPMPPTEPTRPFGTGKKSMKRTIPTVMAGSRPRCSVPPSHHLVGHVNVSKECAVPNCSNTDDTGKRFYRSPVDLHDRLAWLQAMGVRSLKAIRFFVCEDHFPRGGQTMAYVNGKYLSRDGLLSTIIPSLNMPSSNISSPKNASSLQHQQKPVSTPNALQKRVVKKLSARKSEGIRRRASSTFQQSLITETLKSETAVSPSANLSSPTNMNRSTSPPSNTNASQQQQTQTKDVLALLNGNIAKLIAYVQPTIRTVGVSAVEENCDSRASASGSEKTKTGDIPQAPKKTELASTAVEPTPTSVDAGNLSCRAVDPPGVTKSSEIPETPSGESQSSVAEASSDSKSDRPQTSEAKSAEGPWSGNVDKLIDDWKSSISSEASPAKSKYNTRRSKEPNSTGRFNFRFPKNEYVSDISSDESEEALSGWEESSSSWASEDDSFGYNRRRRTKRHGDQQKSSDSSKRPKVGVESLGNTTATDVNSVVKVDARTESVTDATASVRNGVKTCGKAGTAADSKADAKSDKADIDYGVSMDETVATVRVGDREFSYKKVRCPEDEDRPKQTYAQRYFVVSESDDSPDWNKSPPPMPPSLDSLMKGMHSFFDDFISKMEDMHLAFKQQFSGKKDVITLANDWFLMLIDRLNMFPSVIVSELARIVETSRQFFSNEAQKVIRDNKKTRWCSGCWEPAKFHCCFHAAYCSSKCQTKDWKKHKATCSQKQCSLDDPNLRMNQVVTQKLRNLNNGAITISDLERFLEAEKTAKASPVKPVINQFRPLLPKIVSKPLNSVTKPYSPATKSSITIKNNIMQQYTAKAAVPKPNFTAKPTAALTPPDSANDDELTPNYEAESLDDICVVEPDPLAGSQSESNTDGEESCAVNVTRRNLKRRKPVDIELSKKFARHLNTNRTETGDNSDDSSGSLSFTPHFLEGFGSSQQDTPPSEPIGRSAKSPGSANTSQSLSNLKVQQFINSIGLRPCGPGKLSLSGSTGVKPILVKMIPLPSGETQLVQMDESEVNSNPKLLTMAAGWVPPHSVSQSVKSSGSVVISTKPKQLFMVETGNTTTAPVKPNTPLRPAVRVQFPKQSPTPRNRKKALSPAAMPNLTPIVKKDSGSVRIIDDPTLERILNSDNLLMNAFESSFYKNTRIRE